MADVVVVAHAVASVFLAGLIWTVQVVHYPLFARVGSDAFLVYADGHTTRIGALVVLPWSVQGLTVAALLVARPVGVSATLVGTSAVAAAVTVAVTLAVSVRQHRILGGGWDPTAHRVLVMSNWLRTAAWIVGAGAATAILWQYRGGRVT